MKWYMAAGISATPRYEARAQAVAATGSTVSSTIAAQVSQTATRKARAANCSPTAFQRSRVAIQKPRPSTDAATTSETPASRKAAGGVGDGKVSSATSKKSALAGLKRCDRAYLAEHTRLLSETRLS